MAKKDKKKKGDDAPVQEVTGVNWMDAPAPEPEDFLGGMFAGVEEEEEEEEEKPKKGKAKANKQDKGKGKGKKANNDQPTSSGWDEPATAAPAAGASSGWGGTDTGWDQPAASTSQTPYGSLGGMNLPASTAGQWSAYGQQPQTPAPAANPYGAAPANPYAAPAAPMNPYAGPAWSQPSMLGLSNHSARGMHTPAAHQMWIPSMTEAEYDDDDEDPLAAVNQAHMQAQSSAKKNKGKQKDNQNQKKGKKQQRQQETTTPGWGRSPHTSVQNDWASEPPPLAPVNDWSQPPEPPKGKKGKQKGYQQPAPDAADALFAGGYPAYYTPTNSHTLGYAGTTAQPSAYDGAFAVTPTGNVALQEASQALFGRHRPSIQRILWQMPPHHDPRVRDVMAYIQDPGVKMELTTIALRHYVMEREPGCFFVNATYRLPDKPNTPGFDWLRLSELVDTYDRIIQQSLLYYQPLEHALVFVFLVSQTGNSMACWRRKLPIHPTQVAQFQREVSAVKREISQQEHHIFVDSPPLDHFTGFPFSPAVGGHAWGGGTSMYGAASPAPPPEKKVKSGWSWLRR